MRLSEIKFNDPSDVFASLEVWGAYPLKTLAEMAVEEAEKFINHGNPKETERLIILVNLVDQYVEDPTDALQRLELESRRAEIRAA